MKSVPVQGALNRHSLSSLSHTRSLAVSVPYLAIPPYLSILLSHLIRRTICAAVISAVLSVSSLSFPQTLSPLHSCSTDASSTTVWFDNTCLLQWDGCAIVRDGHTAIRHPQSKLLQYKYRFWHSIFNTITKHYAAEMAYKIRHFVMPKWPQQFEFGTFSNIRVKIFKIIVISSSVYFCLNINMMRLFIFT